MGHLSLEDYRNFKEVELSMKIVVRNYFTLKPNRSHLH